MTNKQALQIVLALAMEKHTGQAVSIVYTTKEIQTAIYRVNKHIKYELT